MRSKPIVTPNFTWFRFTRWESNAEIDLEIPDQNWGGGGGGVPSNDSELTGGLMRVMTATPSAPTSIVVFPFVREAIWSLLRWDCDSRSSEFKERRESKNDINRKMTCDNWHTPQRNGGWFDNVFDNLICFFLYILYHSFFMGSSVDLLHNFHVPYLVQLSISGNETNVITKSPELKAQ